MRKVVRPFPYFNGAVYALCWELERPGRYDEKPVELRRYAKHGSLRNYSICRHWASIRGKQKRWKSAYDNCVKAVRPNPPDSGSPEYPRLAKRYRQICGCAPKRETRNSNSFVALVRELIETKWGEAMIDILSTAAMKPHVILFWRVGQMYRGYLVLAEAIDTYREGLEGLSGKIGPEDLALPYTAPVTSLAGCGRNREAVSYGDEAISPGAGEPGLRECYDLVKDGESFPDPVLAVWWPATTLVMPDQDAVKTYTAV